MRERWRSREGERGRDREREGEGGREGEGEGDRGRGVEFAWPDTHIGQQETRRRHFPCLSMFFRSFSVRVPPKSQILKLQDPQPRHRFSPLH